MTRGGERRKGGRTHKGGIASMAGPTQGGQACESRLTRIGEETKGEWVTSMRLAGAVEAQKRMGRSSR
eukprot:3933098-Rhodomonas_salina.1